MGATRATGTALAALLLFVATDGLFLQDPAKRQELVEREAGRVRRQAYPVLKAGSATEVLGIRTSVEESGPWGPWALDRDCSRSCGGGVQMERRDCAGGCKGPAKRYISCNTQPCGDDAQDFRAQQCAKYNDKDFEGNYYSWRPATPSSLKNRCELNCQPEAGGFFMKFADRVEDGTPCDAVSQDICVEGLCVPVGCDGQLGSTKKADKCLVCGGTGQDCKTVEGLYDEKGLELSQYHDVVTLPKGAMSIRIEEKLATNNYLALRNSSGHYVLNGDHRIEGGARVVSVAGAAFDYQRTKGPGVAYETLTAHGPLKDEVTVVLLHQSDGSTGIHYEYSLGLETAQYVLKPAAWSACSVSCGAGVQTRELDCFDNEANAVVDVALCEENNASAPAAERECETVDCAAEWFAGDWETCSASCGDAGWQYRVVYCHKVFADGSKITVADEECGEGRPEPSQECSRFACPEWNAGPWSACSKPCGAAKQYRSVTCRSEKAGEEGKLMPATACPADDDARPGKERACNLGPCTGLDFVIGDWDLCSKCNDTTETRSVKCQDESGKMYPLDKCEGEVPEDERPCNETVECVYLWHTSAWSDCSTNCGQGSQTRDVYCAISTGGDLLQMDDSHCQGPRPNATMSCVKETSCTGKYMTEEWGECSASCAGGTQSRKAHCFTWDFEKDEDLCDPAGRPALTQDCNTDPCPTCADGEFGCCPDNSTYAEGPFLAGCSNCSETEFGCCADNVTAAAGEMFKGCPGVESSESESEMEGSGDEDSSDSSAQTSESMEERPECKENEFGCCPDGVTLAEGPEDEGCPELLCEYKDEEEGTVVTIPCVNDTADATLDMDNATMGNDTDSAENVTLTCKDSEFGCCPDWTTEAGGEDFADCPVFELGVCDDNATAPFGCCSDNVTLARGEEEEGCGASDCSASTFGCCGDRRTIAFGPFYEGCTRSAFPCETADFGCCPDGETAALGNAGEGCGESCLLTKFGCCPDGVQAAEGPKNEGCGCQVAPYGCCPDGETAASGLAFAGCPSTCATSTYGCCPDGKTQARGPGNAGCPCQFTAYGCCADGETAARGPGREGCDDCRYAKHGCCSDGKTIARGPNGAGCPPPPTRAPVVVGGTASPARLAGCSLPKAEGRLCGQYRVQWFYDTDKGKCDRFWYAGCDGNENRFDSEEACQGICVSPPGKGLCYLPKMEGRQDCANYQLSWAYDAGRGACQAFYWRGCDGNNNRFDTQARCESFCFGVGAFAQARPATQAPAVQAPAAPAVAPVPLPARSGSSAFGSPATSASQDAAQWTARGRYGEGSSGGSSSMGSTGVRDYAAEARARQVAERRAAAARRNSERNPCSHAAYPCARTELCFVLPGGRFRCQPDLRLLSTTKAPATPTTTTTTTRLPADDPGRPTAEEVSVEEYEDGYDDDLRDPCEGEPCGEGFDCHIAHDCLPSQPRCLPYDCFSHEATDAHRAPPLPRLIDRGGLLPPTSYPPPGGDVCRPSPCGVGETCHANPAPCDPRETACQLYHCLVGYHVRSQAQAHPQSPERSPAQSPAQRTKAWPKGRWDAQDIRIRPLPDTRTRPAAPATAPPGARTSPDGGDPCSGSPCASGETCFANPSPCDAAKPDCELFRCMVDDRASPTHTRPTPHASTSPSTSPASAATTLVVRTKTETSVGSVCSPSPCADDEECRADGRLCRSGEAESCYACVPRPDSRESLRGGEPCRPDPCHRALEICVPDPKNCVRPPCPQHLCVPRNPCTTMPCGDGERCEPSPTPREWLCLPASTRSPARRLSETECRAPSDSGPCKQYIRSFYFDSGTGRCLDFIYGGCGGNTNRFRSEAACEAQCGAFGARLLPQARLLPTAARAKQRCDLPVDQGSCSGNFPRFYWEPALGQCLPFDYSGCGGNGNRFDDEAACESACQAAPAAAAIRSSQALDAPGAMDPDCLLPTETGTDCPAGKAATLWHYSPLEGTCAKFSYAGCGGNGNRFRTEKECRRRCSRHAFPCELPKVAGPCRMSKPRWYFDYEARRCEEFLFGGCLGNVNNFKSRQACEGRCLTPASAQGTGDAQVLEEAQDPEGEDEEEEEPDVASMFGDVIIEGGDLPAGPHSANLQARPVSDEPMVESETELAEKAGGLERPSEGETEEVLPLAPVLPASHLPFQPPHSPLPELCQLKVEAGSCFGTEAAWYFDSESGSCRGFLYTGCDGNANRFASEEACLRACGHFRDQEVCTLAAEAGPCSSGLPKWAYSAAKGECEPLLFGGCGGNGNRFASREECQQLCQQETQDPIEVCRLPAVAGPCSLAERRWFHSAESGRCEEFSYGGCEGNSNNFASERDCERRCGASELVTSDVCLLSRDAGPCTDPLAQWFFDAADGHCRLFTYGGCRGNANRFPTKDACQLRCQGRRSARIHKGSPGETEEKASASTVGPTLLASPSWELAVRGDKGGRFTAGETVILTCWSGGSRALRGFRWLKEGREVARDDRRSVRQRGRFLKIRGVRTTDSGAYQCQHRRNGYLTEPFRVEVALGEGPAVEEAGDCRDEPAKANCPRIVSSGLCGHPWYARHCCASCRAPQHSPAKP